MVKKEVFEWIKIGKKTIELRKGRRSLGTKRFFKAAETFLEEKSQKETKEICKHFCKNLTSNK